MIIIGVILWVIFVGLLQTLLSGKQNVDSNGSGNLTISSLITESEIEAWLLGPATKNLSQQPPSAEALKETQFLANLTDLNSNDVKVAKEMDSNNTITQESITWDQQLSDEPLSSSELDVMDYILTQPKKSVEGDWSAVLGTFSHYHDENWKPFLIQTEVPLLVRLYLADSSETVTISRIYSKNKTKKLIDVKKKKIAAPDEFEVLIATGSWLLTHESQFTLGKTYIEHDLDGTDSKNTFFFAAPRLLIHNKIKDNWRTTIVRHFDDKGLNMTFIDVDRKVVARRFLKRLS